MTILSKDQLRALTQADRVCFYHGRPDVIDTGAELGAIRAIRVQRDRTFGESEAEVRIAIESEIDDHYATRHGAAPLSVAFEMIHTGAEFNECWAGIVYSLRAGDDLRLQWIADGATNEYMIAQGLHGDMLRLRVKRGARRFAFEIGRQTCPDNSARMIRQRGAY